MERPYDDEREGTMHTILASGMAVSQQPNLAGNTVYADVEPSGSRWLPWPGRTSRWWYEVHSTNNRIQHTLAYEKGGSGGGFTLRSCIRKAMKAVSDVVDESYS